MIAISGLKRPCLSTGIYKGQFSHIYINGTSLNISQVDRAKFIINLLNCSKRDPQTNTWANGEIKINFKI